MVLVRPNGALIRAPLPPKSIEIEWTAIQPQPSESASEPESASASTTEPAPESEPANQRANNTEPSSPTPSSTTSVVDLKLSRQYARQELERVPATTLDERLRATPTRPSLETDKQSRGRPTKDGGYVAENDHWKLRIYKDGRVEVTSRGDDRNGLYAFGFPLVPTKEARRGAKRRLDDCLDGLKFNSLNEQARKRALDICGAIVAAPVSAKVSFDSFCKRVDCFAPSRTQLIEEHQDKIDQINDIATREKMRVALKALRTKLDAIWNDPSKSIAERQVAIKALWDDCADDKLGHKAKRVIRTFVTDRATSLMIVRQRTGSTASAEDPPTQSSMTTRRWPRHTRGSCAQDGEDIG